ncbi:MAG TPA: class I SAM-dependent methyltransferase family protein [Solirubrobacteraceae bacterium]|jgi:precorrin-6B methylase 2|nr:class I SAM-dependent methyltransferase family protein [Solirubrobacteraceae bacterium]
MGAEAATAFAGLPRPLPPTPAELSRPLPLRSGRAWRYAAAGAASRAGALLSEGLRIGYAHGFDSGPFMAHVYANRATGRTPLGRALDRHLLDRPTCQAFRDIRALAERAVLEAVDALGAQGTSAPVMADLAAGSAPYLLRALEVRPGARAIAGDIDPGALEVAHAAARDLGVERRLTLARGDAFDRAALTALPARPDVVLELGLYGIYHDDALIERHFRDLAELVGPRQIVFNVQTQNPEIEHIARVWRNAAGGPCVWRLRPVEQVLAYADAAGFAPVTQTADRHGIYRVVRLERKGRP